MDIDLSKRSVVLDFRFSDGRAVVRDKHKLSKSVSDGLDGGGITESSLAWSHNEGELGLDVILSDFLDHLS